MENKKEIEKMIEIFEKKGFKREEINLFEFMQTKGEIKTNTIDYAFAKNEITLSAKFDDKDYRDNLFFYNEPTDFDQRDLFYIQVESSGVDYVAIFLKINHLRNEKISLLIDGIDEQIECNTNQSICKTYIEKKEKGIYLIKFKFGSSSFYFPCHLDYFNN